MVFFTKLSEIFASMGSNILPLTFLYWILVIIKINIIVRIYYNCATQDCRRCYHILKILRVVWQIWCIIKTIENYWNGCNDRRKAVGRRDWMMPIFGSRNHLRSKLITKPIERLHTLDFKPKSGWNILQHTHRASARIIRLPNLDYWRESAENI